MISQRWQRLQSLFREARRLPTEERDAYVQRACKDDHALAAELRALLAQDVLDDDTIGHIVQQAADCVLASDDGRRAWIGRRLGAWRISAHLADGGMGAVFRAERADGQYEQQAAIKLLNPAFVAGQGGARLAAERQILARLEHPHIARLLDGGSTDDGAPYLVMEYVDGTPIDAYCNAKGLDTAARLRLFQQVCGAVDYAHRNLVVHRDLKPANILVDREGQPKLLDFGIAKLVEGAEAKLTAAHQRVLTPTHASPEQIRGEPVTTSTDVYALGVLLYELLAGRLPYAADEKTPGSAAQLARQILETEPRTPSAAVTQGSNERIEAARRRGDQLTPERLRRELQGDLDNIVLMALRKEPARRYASAQALGEDIARHLADEPVSARPATTAYRVGKFLVRHRVGALASVAAVLGAISLVAFYTWQLSLERDRAQANATRAEKVSEFLAGVFSVADPTNNLGETVTARELLDRGTDRIERDLAGQPEVQAALLDAMGDAYRNLGLYPQAHDLQTKALDRRAAVSGTASKEYALALHRVAQVTIDLGKYEEGIDALERSLAILRGSPPVDPLAVSAVLRSLAFAQWQAGKDFAAAERNYRAAIEAAQSAGAAGDRNLARAIAGLGGVLQFTGKLSEARRWREESLALHVKAFGETHPDTIRSMSDLGNLLVRESRYIEAIAQFERALPLARKVYGDDHISTAYIRANLGNAMNDAGRFAEAEALMRATLPVFQARLGEDHPRTAYLTENLANAIYYQARYDEALPMYLDSLEILRRKFGDSNGEYGISLSNLCGVYVAMERFENAVDTCRRAHAVLQGAFGPGHVAGVRSLTKLGAALTGLHRFDAADATLRLALERAQINLPESHSARADIFGERGKLALARDQPQEAERLFREGLRIAIANQPDGGLPVASRELDLGKALTRLERYGEAESLLLKSYPVLLNSLGEAHEAVQRARRSLVELYIAWGRPEQAVRYRSPGERAAAN